MEQHSTGPAMSLQHLGCEVSPRSLTHVDGKQAVGAGLDEMARKGGSMHISNMSATLTDKLFHVSRAEAMTVCIPPDPEVSTVD